MESGWKIDRRRRACSKCSREFASEERHVSAIRQAGERFERLDACLTCWPSMSPEGPEAPFSFWHTNAPKREKRRLEDLQAMTEFFKKLLEKGPGDPILEKVAYLTALLLMRKRRVRAAGSRVEDGRTWLLLEKSWDGETCRIVDPPIPDEELVVLRGELERLFDLELGAPQTAQA